MASPTGSPPPWPAALAFALLGRVPDGLSESGRVDLTVLLRDLDGCWPGGVAAIRAELVAQDVARLPVRPIPEHLRARLPAAQLAAALSELEGRLALAKPRRVATPRALDADDRRLQADVPPHHGT